MMSWLKYHPLVLVRISSVMGTPLKSFFSYFVEHKA